MMKRTTLRLILSVVLLALFLVLAEGCASSRGNTKKKLKPGKPIPCPQKDC